MHKMTPSSSQTNNQKRLYKGLSLYPSIIRKVKVNEERLIRAGYKESKKKPLLFYKPTKDCTFFADVRGTEIVPIWVDSSPLFYVRFTNDYPNWKKGRIINSEIGRLKEKECRVRLYVEYGDDDDESTGYDGSDGFWNERVNYGWEEDGYCKVCGKDFQDSGFFCSEKCALKVKFMEQRRYANNLVDNAPICEVCNRKILANEYDYNVLVAIYPQYKDKCIVSKTIEHHTSYEDDITMIVCASCHAKIHQSNEWCEYTPVDSRLKQHQKTKLVNCSCCNNKARVDYYASKDEIENAICSRCRSKSMLPRRGLKYEVKCKTKWNEFSSTYKQRPN